MFDDEEEESDDDENPAVAVMRTMTRRARTM